MVTGAWGPAEPGIFGLWLLTDMLLNRLIAAVLHGHVTPRARLVVSAAPETFSLSRCLSSESSFFRHTGVLPWHE